MDPEPGAGLLVTVEHGDDKTIVVVAGELEHATARPLRNVLAEVARDRPPTLVVDLADVTFMDSTGISLLLQAKDRCAADHCGFALRRPSQRVLRVIELSGLTDLFEIDAEPL